MPCCFQDRGVPRALFPLEEWALQYEEDAFEPELEIFDPHHHLWDPANQDKGWPIPKCALQIVASLRPHLMNKFMNTVNAMARFSFGERNPFIVPYMGPELVADIKGNGKGHKVLGTVYIECGWKTPGVEEALWPVAEAAAVEEVHKAHPSICNAIIAHADLRLGAGCEKALQAYSKMPLVKGIRHSQAWDADARLWRGDLEEPTNPKDYSMNPKFREGVALLSKYGFTYDVALWHTQLDELTSLAKALPETTIILDHIGFPLGMGGNYKKEESFPVWLKSIKEMAATCPNVHCKVGGFGSRFMGFGFDERDKPPTSDELAKAWEPYITEVIAAFGVDRCMMESNFPVDKVSCSYTVCFNALKKVVRNFSEEDKKKLFSLNAMKVYRMYIPPTQ